MGEGGTPRPRLGETAEKSEFVFSLFLIANQLEAVTVSIPRNDHKALKVFMLILNSCKSSCVLSFNDIELVVKINVCLRNQFECYK